MTNQTDQYIDDLDGVTDDDVDVYENAEKQIDKWSETILAAMYMKDQVMAFYQGKITIGEMMNNMTEYQENFGTGLISDEKL